METVVAMKVKLGFFGTNLMAETTQALRINTQALLMHRTNVRTHVLRAHACSVLKHKRFVQR